MAKHQVKRKDFSDLEIQVAMHNAENSKRKAAEELSAKGRGKVSHQLLRYWWREMNNCDTSTREAKSEEQDARKEGCGGGGPAPSKTEVPDGPKVLLLDIETSPIEGRVWGLWKQNVGLNQIVKEWNILSYCAKWLGQDSVAYSDLRDAENIADDSKLVAELYTLLDAADMVIAQNGKRFDVPKIQARFVLAGYKPPRPFKVIDTLLMAKQQFGFTSNKLEWMTDKLCATVKRKHEKFPGMELWNQCLAGNPEAWEEMRLYNIDDVQSMEELYLILRPWYVGHPNVAMYFDNGELGMDGKPVGGAVKCRCPKCASTNIMQSGWVYTQAGKYEQMHCGNCGGWSRGRYTRNSIQVRKAQLSN